MRRLDDKFLVRTKRFAHRMVDVAERIESSGKRRVVTQRIVGQIVGAGTSVGANAREADEAMSRADFCKSLGIVLKELSESRYWIEFVGERNWIKPARLQSLLDESIELSKVFFVMVARSRPARAKPARSV